MEKEVSIYASGLGLWFYPATLRAELATYGSSLPPTALAVMFQLEVGSPQVFYEIVWESAPSAPVLAEGDARGHVVADDGGLAVCDGYAELDWLDDGYAHQVLPVPTGLYSLTLRKVTPHDPANDLRLELRLWPLRNSGYIEAG